MAKALALGGKNYLGGCLCGAVRFEAIGAPETRRTCSCEMCRRHSGALTVVWIEFPIGRVKWTGAQGEPALYASSPLALRAFCPTCGSSIGAIDPQRTAVALMLGAFDRPKRLELAPSTHAYKADRPLWWHVEIRVTTTVED
jgi:hypothetical protein